MESLLCKLCSARNHSIVRPRLIPRFLPLRFCCLHRPLRLHKTVRPTGRKRYKVQLLHLPQVWLPTRRPGYQPSFTLLSPREGESALTNYTFHNHRVHHRFCPKCGVRCYIKSTFVYEGKEFHFMGINALTLDRRVDRKSMEDLRKIKTKY